MDLLLAQEGNIDTVLLACTHYPLLINKIRQFVPENVTIISQGEIVAKSLVDYLARHPEIEQNCSKNRLLDFYTTDLALDFDNHAATFFGKPVKSTHIEL